MTPQEIHSRADAFAWAWHDVLGVVPSKAAALLGLAVAMHETQLGTAMADARGCAENWGACTRRRCAPAELALLEHLPPSAAVNLVPAQAALAATIPDDCILWRDSAPTVGWYWTMFARFPTPRKGAGYEVETLGKHMPSCRAAMDACAEVTAGACFTLASHMYACHYFMGFHDPRQPGGIAANIGDYSGALWRCAQALLGALATWTPMAPDDVAPTQPSPAPDACVPDGVSPEVPSVCVEPPADGSLTVA